MKKILLLILAFAVGGLIYANYSTDSLPPDTRIDSLLVYKSQHYMDAYSQGKRIKRYTVSLGRHAVGHKMKEGDKRTPEGRYVINAKNSASAYHKNLGISYPNAADRRTARSLGVSPGGDVKIHGLRNGLGFIGRFHRFRDWTAGCVAVTNDEMDELFVAVHKGTPIIIYQ
jgi:murein L,D-transpeptidase YafK